MKLRTAIAAHLCAKRASGMVYKKTEPLLRSFGRVAGDIPVERIPPGTVRAYCTQTDSMFGLAGAKWIYGLRESSGRTGMSRAGEVGGSAAAGAQAREWSDSGRAGRGRH